MTGVFALALVATAIVIAVHPGSAPSGPIALSSSFDMHFDNLTFNAQTGGSLADVTQDSHGRITGVMTVNPPLYGTGPFSGTRVGSTVHFAGASRGDYRGVIGPDGAISGTYTYPNQRGEWSARPTQPNPKHDAAWPPLWLWVVMAAAVSGFIVSLAWWVSTARRRGAGSTPSA